LLLRKACLERQAAVPAAVASRFASGGDRFVYAHGAMVR
jgi:hypothetical protein